MQVFVLTAHFLAFPLGHYVSDFKFAARSIDWTPGFVLENSDNSKNKFHTQRIKIDNGNFLVLLTHEQMVLLILSLTARL